MVRFTASIYQSKAVERFRLCSIFNSRNRKATGSRKTSLRRWRIKANFDFRAQLVRKECPCATGKKLSERTDSAKVLQNDYSPVIEQINRLSNVVNDKFREIHYRVLNALCVSDYYIYAELEKRFRNWERFAFEEHWLVYVSSFNRR